MDEARRLTVAHQKPGECAYCDDRHTRIVAAVAHELAEEIRQESGPDDSDQRFLIYNNGWYDARGELADLIDPEVE